MIFPKCPDCAQYIYIYILFPFLLNVFFLTYNLFSRYFRDTLYVNNKIVSLNKGFPYLERYKVNRCHDSACVVDATNCIVTNTYYLPVYITIIIARNQLCYQNSGRNDLYMRAHASLRAGILREFRKADNDAAKQWQRFINRMKIQLSSGKFAFVKKTMEVRVKWIEVISNRLDRKPDIVPSIFALINV